MPSRQKIDSLFNLHNIRQSPRRPFVENYNFIEYSRLSKIILILKCLLTIA
jgi:hypothetical protein